MASKFISHLDLFDRFSSRQKTSFIDVRDSEDFNHWKIYQSINIPLSKLSHHIKSLPKDDYIVTVCEDGKEAKNASVFLENSGFDAYTLKGGLKKWNCVYDIVRVNPSRTSKNTIYQVKRLGKGCLSYMLVLSDGVSVLIIDPTYHTDVYLDFIEGNGLKAVAVIDTHLHTDHVSGGLKISKKLSIPYLLQKNSEVNFSYTPIEDELAKFFPNNSLKILHTPGHADEGVSIAYGKSFVLTGDTIFLDNVGRADFGQDLEENAKQLYQSIKDKIFALHDDIYVLPGHTYTAMVPGPSRAATLRYVKRFNNIRSGKSLDKFIKLQKSNNIPKPINAEKILELNRSGVLRLRDNLEDLEKGSNYNALVI